MAAAQTMEALQLQVDELRTALTTVTEALVLFQEFIEQEIGEFAYFRDSGSHFKLIETLNKMRNFAVAKNAILKAEPVKPPANEEIAVATTKPIGESEEEEQVEVDVDYSDEDQAMDEITIRQVYSIPSPETETAEALLRMRHNNSSITITPVFPPEGKLRRAEDNSHGHQPHHYVCTQPAVIIPAEKQPPPPPTFVPMSVNPPHVIIDQRMHVPVPNIDMKDYHVHSTLMHHPPPPPVQQPPAPVMTIRVPVSNPMPVPIPPVVPTVPVVANKAKKAEKKKKTTVSRIQGNSALKRKVGRPPKISAMPFTPQSNDNSDQPLDLQKKVRRPSARPVKCQFCGKCYSSKGVMSRHIKEAHREEPQFPCFYCPFKFRNGPARLEHMNTSHPEDMNSVICPYCKRKSSSVAGKRNHMMLCAKKYRGTPTKTSNKAATTSPSDSGVEMEVSLSG